MSIRYTKSLDGIDATMLAGFFEGWPRQPGPDEHWCILKGSSHIVLAIDETTGQIIGRIRAISDGCHSAFVSMLEVLPSYRGRGIGRQMAERLFDALRRETVNFTLILYSFSFAFVAVLSLMMTLLLVDVFRG